MTFAPGPEPQEIRAAVLRLAARLGDDYWRVKDTEGGFPWDLHPAMVEASWLGVIID
jgi:acyl-CoA dehydrogenase